LLRIINLAFLCFHSKIRSLKLEYELVFTAPGRAVKQAQKIVKCTVVGQVVKKSQGINLPKEGFEHFAK